MITIKDLSFRYDRTNRDVLNELNFEIVPGTVNVLLGLNGCGKTTLIKLLAGLLDVNHGDIQYDGKSIKDLPIKERSKVFAYVAQIRSGNDEFLVKDYLAYGFVNTLKFYESPKKEQLEQVDAIAKRFNIEHLLGKELGQLSGGEKQIVTIASAIIQNTPIVILDEPTSALDLKNQNLVLSILKDIAKDGKTIIMSSHNPNHALFLDANVLLMNDGEIKKIGNAKEIINVDILKEVYGDAICLSKDLPYSEISFN